LFRDDSQKLQFDQPQAVAGEKMQILRWEFGLVRQRRGFCINAWEFRPVKKLLTFAGKSNSRSWRYIVPNGTLGNVKKRRR
jgi:hypothetical protein